MPFANPTVPNLADFKVFVYQQGVPESALPTDSEWFGYAFDYAKSVVLLPPATMPAALYVLAVYNLGMQQLLEITPDQEDSTYFEDQREKFGLLSVTAGPVIQSGDENSSTTLLPAEWMKNMTLQDNDCMKTIWGRRYLKYAQPYGPNITGVS